MLLFSLYICSFCRCMLTEVFSYIFSDRRSLCHYHVIILKDRLRTFARERETSWIMKATYIQCTYNIKNERGPRRGSGVPQASRLVPTLRILGKKKLRQNWHTGSYITTYIATCISNTIYKIVQSTKVTVWGLSNFWKSRCYNLFEIFVEISADFEISNLENMMQFRILYSVSLFTIKVQVPCKKHEKIFAHLRILKITYHMIKCAPRSMA